MSQTAMTTKGTNFVIHKESARSQIPLPIRKSSSNKHMEPSSSRYSESNSTKHNELPGDSSTSLSLSLSLSPPLVHSIPPRRRSGQAGVVSHKNCAQCNLMVGIGLDALYERPFCLRWFCEMCCRLGCHVCHPGPARQARASGSGGRPGRGERRQEGARGGTRRAGAWLRGRL